MFIIELTVSNNPFSVNIKKFAIFNYVTFGSEIKVKVIYQPEKGLYQVKDTAGGFEVSSSIKIQNLALFHVTKTEDYQIRNEAVVFADAVSGSITFTMPDANLYDGNIFRIKKIDQTGNLVIVSGSNGETIDGSVSLSIDSPYTTLSIISNGQNWFII